MLTYMKATKKFFKDDLSNFEIKWDLAVFTSKRLTEKRDELTICCLRSVTSSGYWGHLLDIGPNCWLFTWKINA